MSKNKDMKRKAARYKGSCSTQIEAENTAKMPSKPDTEFFDPIAELLFSSEPASEAAAPPASPKEAAPGDLFSPEPASEANASPVSPKKVAPDEVTTISPPTKKIIRRKRPAVNPFRKDIRMGVSGKTTAGSGALTIQKPTPAKPANPTATKALPQKVNPPPTHLPRKTSNLTSDEKAAKAALKKLKATTTAAASSKQSSTILTDMNPHSIPGMLKQLVAADRSIAKPRGAAAKAGAMFKNKKKEYRDDGTGIDELLEKAFGHGRAPASAAQLAALSKGAKNLLKSVGGTLDGGEKPVVNRKNLGKVSDKGKTMPGMRSMIAAMSENLPTGTKRKRECEKVENIAKRVRVDPTLPFDPLFDE